MKRFFTPSLLAIALFASSCHMMGDGGDIKVSGTLEMTEHTVGARVPGRIATLHFDDGSTVTKGEVMATLDRYEQTKRDLERLQRQQKKGGASDQSVELASLAVEDQRIVSPVDGVVLTKVRELGEVVGAGGPVAVIGDRSRIWVRVYVPEGQIARVHLGTPASIFFDGIPEPLPGHVIYIAPQAEFTPRNVQSQDERVTQTFAVKVALDHPEPSIKPGIASDVILHTANNGVRR